MPRRFRHFDYATASPVAVGDVVRAPFAGRDVRGVVVGTSDASDEPRLKHLGATIEEGAMTQGDVTRILTLAAATAQSAGALFALALPELRGGSVTLALPSVRATADPERVASVQRLLAAAAGVPRFTAQVTPNEAALMVLALRKATKRQLFVLVPRERDAEIIASTVPLGRNAALMTGKTPPASRGAIAKGWRDGSIATLVGTRQAALLPAHSLDAVLVLECGNDEHRNDRRNPRFDGRNAAALLAEQHGAQLIALDALPRPEDVDGSVATMWAPWPSATLIDMTKPQERGDVGLVSSTLQEEIKTALQSQESVLLLFNRKGVAKRLQCKACGHIPLCGTCDNLPTVRQGDLACVRCGAEMWVPKTCPACGAAKLGLRGIGGAKLEADLRRIFPQATVTRVEKGAQGASGDIVLATEYYFSSVARPFGRRFGLTADVMADVGLVGSDFRSTERVARRIARLRALAAESGGTCIVQTYSRDAVLPLCDSEIFVANELVTRKTYGLPPFATIISVTENDVTTPKRYDAVALPDALTALNNLPNATTVYVDNPHYDSHGAP